MRTDDVDNNDLDRELRDLLEPVPRSKAWERSQRDRLLTYIETGEIAADPATWGAESVRLAGVDHSDERAATMPSRRRPLVLGGAAAAVVLLVVGLVVTERPGEPSPAQAPPTERGSSPSVSVADVDETHADVDNTGSDPTITEPAPSPTAFTPLVVGTPPPGYALTKVENSAGGVLTYDTDANSTELWLVVRDSSSDPEFFDAQMRDLGRRSWVIDGRTVWSDGELDGCLPDVCSVGVQWDDRTVVRLQWVEPDAGTLAPGSDQDSLLALLPTVTVDPSVWANGTEVSAEISDDETGVLLAPPVDVVVESASALMSGPPGSMSAVVRTPNGSILNLYLSRNPEPLDDVPATVGSQSFGGLAVRGIFDAQIDTYGTAQACWTLRVADGGGTGNIEPWRTEITELFESLEVSDNFLEVALPPGWNLLSLAEPAPMYEVVLPVEGHDTSISILQSPARGVAYAATLAAHDVEQVRFLDTDAWAGTVEFDPTATTVYWIRNGTYSTATASGLSVEQIEEVVAAMQPITQAQWEDRFEMVDDPEEGTGSCPPVTLSIAAS